MSENHPESTAFRIGLDHAWAWFQLHAGQRMQLVNFWLVASAFLASALVTAASRSHYALSLILGLSGLVATVCFHRLEHRTRRLVHVGEGAIRHLQRTMAEATGIDELEMVLAADHHSRILGGYGQIIRVLHAAGALAFAGAAVWSAIEWAR
jgi:hypothetical protein